MTFPNSNEQFAISAALSANVASSAANTAVMAVSILQTEIDSAAEQAQLANRYANADTDADIPGAAPGERGAKYWAGEVAADVFARQLDALGLISTESMAGATFSRASAVLVEASDGSIFEIGTDKLRLPCSAGVMRGVGIESGFTQLISNVDFSDDGTAGIIGSGGAWPANISTTTTAGSNFERENVRSFVEGGVTYFEFRFARTGSGTGDVSMRLNLAPTAFGQGIPAVQGETFYSRIFIGIHPDDDPSLLAAIRYGINERNSSGTYLGGDESMVSLNKDTLDTGRILDIAASYTTVNASCAKVTPCVLVTGASGSMFNVRVRIGIPNLHEGRERHSPTLVTGAVPADIIEGTIRTPIPAGTLLVEGWAPFGVIDSVAGQADDDSESNRVTVRRESGDCYATVYIGGMEVADINVGPWLAGCYNKVAVQWSASKITASMAGGQISSVSGDFSALSVLSHWRAGANSAGANVWNGSLLKCIVTASQENLRTLTSPVSIVTANFKQADGPLTRTPNGALGWQSVQQTVSTSAVRNPLVRSNMLVSPSAALESNTGNTACYPGLDLGAALKSKRFAVRFSLSPAVTGAASITGGVLTVTSLDTNPLTDAFNDFATPNAGGVIEVGTIVKIGGSSRPVTALGTGTGGVGTYTVSGSGDVTNTTFTAFKPNGGNVTLLSQGNGLSEVNQVTGTGYGPGSVHVSFTDSVLRFTRFDSGVETLINQVGFPTLSDDGTLYEAAWTHLEGDFFSVELPNGGQTVVYSEGLSELLGRYVISEPYWSNDGAHFSIAAVSIEPQLA